MTQEEKERSGAELQRKVASLERRLQGNLSRDEHLQELLQEVSRGFTLVQQGRSPFSSSPSPVQKSSLEQSVEESRAELLSLRRNHAERVGSLEAQVHLTCHHV